MRKLSEWKRAFVVCGLWAVTAIAEPAQTFKTLVNFDVTNGASPGYESLAQGLDGNLYGSTYYGGTNGYGTVFKITPSGTLTTLHIFVETEGAHPNAALILARDGNFYGTTFDGGANHDGTVFKITASGTLTTLHSFDFTDGFQPFGALVQATDGNFYGTTLYGGSNNICSNNCGTIFKITSGGTVTTLHNFSSTDGSVPVGLVQARDGNFYGTTFAGGANDDGTVFKITASGTLTTLHSFDSTDGATPSATLVQGTDGNFYGTTELGGASNDGTVFKITRSGTLTTLHSFAGYPTDGTFPLAVLIQATDRRFYGTTLRGGVNEFGTIFTITPAGALTMQHSFDSSGTGPFGGLVQGTDGTFYGTTGSGGLSNDGTVFSLAVGLGPFVETLPTFGKVGAAVKILGTNLTGATSVTFNGTPTTFTVVSGSLITTAVPTGATTGKVQVTTPGGTFTSNVPFRVR